MRKALYNFLKPHFWPLLGLSLLVFVFMFPAFKHINNGLWGFRGDNFFVVWVYWFRDFALLHNLNPDYSYYIGYPFGENIRAISEEILWTYPLQLFILLFGPFTAYNLINILSFIFTGFTAYLFTLHFSKNKWAAFLAGSIFTLSPYHFWQSYTHLSLAILIWMPLYYLWLFKTAEHPTVKKGIVLALLFGLNYYTSFYYGFFNAVVTGAFGVGIFAFKMVKDKRLLLKGTFYQDLELRKLFFSFLTFGILTGVLIIGSYLAFTFGDRHYGTGSTLIKKPLEHLFGLSARPWDYLLPPPNHPFLGDLSDTIYNKIRSIGDDYKTISAFLPERILYVGVTTFIFAGVGMVVNLKSRRRKLALLLIYLITVIFLFSMPPVLYFKTHPIYLPSYYTYQFNNFIRAYARIGIILLLMLLPLFAWGYEFLEEKFKKSIENIKLVKKPKRIFFFLVLGLIIFEFLNFKPFYFSDMRLKDYYSFIKDQPGDFGIVEYPKNVDLSENVIAQFDHGKRIFNMTSNNPYYPVFEKIDAINDSYAATILDDFNIRYLIVHTFGLPHPIDETWMNRFATKYPKGEKGSELELVYKGEQGLVYKYNPAVKSKVVVLSEDPRIPAATVPSGDKWDIEGVSDLIIINIADKPKKVKIGFKVKDEEKTDYAYTLVNYESDLKTYFNNTLLIEKDKLVVPINLLEPLRQISLYDFKVEVVE